MKKGMKKKLLCTILFFVLLLQAGCSKNQGGTEDGKTSAEASGEPTAMGRYVEKEIALPKEAEKETIKLIYDREGVPAIITLNTAGEKWEFFQYIMKEDESFQREPAEWLNGLNLKSGNQLFLTVGENGSYYALSKEGEEMARVFQSEDGKKAEELKLPILDNKNEYDGSSFYWYFSDIKALGNGYLMLYTYDTIYLVDAQSGKTVREIPGGDSSSTKEAVNGTDIYQISGKGDSIALLDGTSGESTKTFPAKVTDIYGTRMTVGQDQNLILVNSDGIQLLKNGSDLWETVVDGSSNTMGSPNYYTVGFVAGKANDYYVYYSSMSSPSKLIHYVYDPDTPTEPDKTLTIYALSDNNIIRQAAVEFQTGNPSVKVDFQVMNTEESGADKGDYIRSFNTELLNGKGPDLIVLDGLPQESYIEKGVLADLSDVMEPITASGDFLSNLEQSCRTEDGGLYAVPVRMRLPLAFGKENLTAMAGNLHELAGYITEHPDEKIFGILDQTVFLNYYFNIMRTDLIDDKKQMNKEALQSFLNDIKTILDASGVSDGSDEKRPARIWGLIEQGNGLALGEMAGIFAGEFDLSAVHQGGFSMAPVNNVWIPSGEIGINKASENKELAEEFLKTVFSLPVQQTDYYDGFTVSGNALDKLLTTENHTADAEGGTTVGADGKEYAYAGGWPPKDQLKQLIGFCRSATQRAVLDSTLSDILLKETEGFFKGTKSLEDTCASITSKYQTYLTE